MTSPNIIVRQGNSQLYGVLYSAAWRTGTWLPEQDWALTKDPETWEKVRRDPVVEHAISQRLHSIAARPNRVMPGGEDDASKRLAELIERVVEEIENFTTAQYQLSQGIMLGRTYGYMEGKRERRDFEGFPRMNLWIPRRIVPVDRRRIRFTPKMTYNERGQLSGTVVTPELWSLQTGVCNPLSPEAWANFIKVVYDDDESRLGYGRGILGAIYFYHYAKGVTLREGLKGVERWAQGLKIVKIDENREASSGKTNEQLQQDYMDVIDKSMARNTIVMGQGDDLKVEWPNSQGTSMVIEMLNYLDRGVTQLILGSVLPTGGGGDVGSNARAGEEAESTERLVTYDRKLLDEAISRDLVGQFLRVNRAELQKAGLGAAKRPRISSINRKRSDPETASRIVTALLGVGVDLRADEVYEETGWTKPKPGEELIKGTKPSPSGIGGIPDMPDLPGDHGSLPEEPGLEPTPAQQADSAASEAAAPQEAALAQLAALRKQFAILEKKLAKPARARKSPARAGRAKQQPATV